jgi:hypothetical protein
MPVFTTPHILFFIYIVFMLAAIVVHSIWLSSTDFLHDEILDLVIVILVSILFLLSLLWLKETDNSVLVIPAAIILLLYMVAANKTPSFSYNPNMTPLRNWALWLGGVTCILAISAVGISGPTLKTIPAAVIGPVHG